jgi:hypothetical protein
MTSAMERDPDAFGGANGAPRQGEQLQAAASGLMDQATRTAEARGSTTMTQVGETLDSVAAAIRSAGDSMREQQPEIAGLVETAAERVQSAGTYLRDHGPREALQTVQQAARSQPALVVGGGLIAGLLVGRLLRGGASAIEPSGSHGRYGSGYDPGTYPDGGFPVGGSSVGGGYGAGYGADVSTAAGGYGTVGGYGTDPGYGITGGGAVGTDVGSTDAMTGRISIDDVLSDGDLMDDSVTGDGVRDEAPSARGAR